MNEHKRCNEAVLLIRVLVLTICRRRKFRKLNSEIFVNRKFLRKGEHARSKHAWPFHFSVLFLFKRYTIVTNVNTTLTQHVANKTELFHSTSFCSWAFSAETPSAKSVST